MERSLELIRRLQQPEIWPDDVKRVDLIETHISWVLLTGRWAYKIKKPVDLGFLDFTTLARRDHFAHEELRLNRRLAPELYQDVIRITGTPEAPRFDGPGPLLEVAVRMRQFEQARQLDRELAAGSLCPDDLEEVADEVAAFQETAPRAEAADLYGTPDAVMEPVRENFEDLRVACADLSDLSASIERLASFSEQAGRALTATFDTRRAGGFIREGHGDLHLANLTRLPEGIRAFDCIEFSPDLRWIDVVADIAFLVMDLAMKRREDLAWTFLNAWLTRTGDYQGLETLRFYWLYRTMVRAKVSALRRNQQMPGEGREASEASLRDHLHHGETLTTALRPRLVLTHGVSGSGKSWLARRLAAKGGFVHLRSDVERKRLFGLRADARTQADLGSGLYAPEVSARTYARLAEIAGLVLDASLGVIVDATFLKAAHREPFLELARARGLEPVVLTLDAPQAILEDRVRARLAAGTDPSEADVDVLRGQLAEREHPRKDPDVRIIEVESSDTPDIDSLAARLR